MISRNIESFLELIFGFFILFFLIEHTTLGYDSLRSISRHLGYERLSMLDLFKLILNGNLKLENPICIFSILNLLHDLLSFQIHGSLKQGLSMVQLVLINIWKKLGELIVTISSISVILYLEITIS